MNVTFLIFVNNSEIANVHYVFTAIYSLEIILMLYFYGLFPVIVIATIRSSFNRNVSLLIIHIAVNYIVCTAGRIVLIFYQYYDLPLERSDSILVTACIVREIIIGAMTSAICALALDRVAATFHWAWYEGESPSTIVVFLLLALFIECFALFNSFGFYFRYWVLGEFWGKAAVIPVVSIYLECGVAMSLWISCYNLTERRRLKKIGAQINCYSVARAYQLDENTRIMKSMRSLFAPTLALNLPCYLFFILYLVVPEVDSFPFRYFFVALYDLWIAIYAVYLYTWIVFCEPAISAQTRRLWIVQVLLSRNKKFASFLSIEEGRSDPAFKTSANDSNVYFEQLNRQLQ